MTQTVLLGVQTNKGKTDAVAHWKANRWAPTWAKSYALTIRHTDYHGAAVDAETGYADVAVTYSTKRTSQHTVDRDPVYPV